MFSSNTVPFEEDAGHIASFVVLCLGPPLGPKVVLLNIFWGSFLLWESLEKWLWDRLVPLNIFNILILEVSPSLWGVSTGEWHGQSIKPGKLLFKLGVISFIYHPLINSWPLCEKWTLPSSWKQEKESCHLHSLCIFNSFLSVLFTSS